MKSVLLNEGFAALTTQAASPSTYLTFNGFSIGDAVTFENDDNRIVPYGTIVFTGTTANMRWSRISDDQVTLTLFVEHDDPRIAIGNILLYLTSGEAFSLTYRSWPFEKLVTSVNTSAGMKYVLNISLYIPNLLGRFSFSNIIEASATQHHYVDEGHINYPHYENYDQVIIDNFRKYNKSVPILNVGNHWFGNPLAMRMDDPKYKVRLNGGIAGDGYQYVFNQG